MSKASFEISEDSQLGAIVHLQQSDISADIAIDYGSNLISLKKDGYELIHTNRSKLMEHAYTGCFVLYPFPNRIKNRAFTFQNTFFDLHSYPQRVSDAALIHGLAHDAKWRIEEQPHIEGNEVVFTTALDWNTSQEFFSLFPIPSNLTLEYRLSPDAIRIEYTVTNMSQQPLPFGFALHPSFHRLSGDETTILLPAQEIMEMDKKLLPTGRTLDVNTVMFRQFDLRKPIPITSALRLDHVYTNIDVNEDIVLNHPREKIAVHISASKDCKFVVIHTLGADRTVEIEPQTCSTNAVNADDYEKSGLLVLRPDEKHTGFIQYKLR